MNPVQERVERKAAALREAILDAGIAFSPDPGLKYADLPEERKVRWRELAAKYLEIFG